MRHPVSRTHFHRWLPLGLAVLAWICFAPALATDILVEELSPFVRTLFPGAEHFGPFAGAPRAAAGAAPGTVVG